MEAATILIDPHFASLIPPLTPEEFVQLEQNLLAEGCRDPLVVWGNTLVDGHNRYQICTRHHLPFQVVQKHFTNLQEAEVWVVHNQLGRRNLNSYQRSLLTLKLKDAFHAQAQERMIAGKRIDPPQKFAEGETRTHLGELANVSRETIRKVEFVEANGSEGLRQQARQGEISVHHAYETARLERVQGRALHAQQVLHANESNEWYTPTIYVEAVRELLGEIDLDPASSSLANQVVQAARFLTIDNDGLRHPWPGRVYLNPPYGFDGQDSNQAIWSGRLIEQYTEGITREAVLLVNATPERRWFQPMWDYLICFTDHRIRFYRPGTEAHQPTHGNAFVYFGTQRDHFAAIFRRFGAIVQRAAGT